MNLLRARKYLPLIMMVVLCGGIRGNGNAQSQIVSKMLNTKHNLGVGGSGTIKASTERDICVFCHAPHVPKQFAAEQLWNHRMSSANYTLYSSDYLTALTYTAPNQPNPRSKLCLSCHDGTVALGAVYNNAGASSILMANGVTTMPTGAAGNLGTSLANDHPVGYLFDTGKDPELIPRSWPWKTQIKLDPDAVNGTVECISCHEPHDNQYGKFLRIDNTNAAMCIFCHSKTGWPNAIHKTSIQSFTPPDSQSTTTIGEWACRNCHKSHNGEGIPYLLNKIEERTCYESGCHGSAMTGANTKNIQSEMEKLYPHPTNSVIGKHRDPDLPASLDAANRHAECQDCHNLHQARKGLHTLQGNQVSNVLKGTSGVLPGFATIWTQPSTFTGLKPAVQENHICFKCHSSYAFGIVPDGVTTIIGPSGARITDQAMEFNPANHSAHPVQVSLTGMTGSLAPKALDPLQMSVDWNNVGNQTMYCSDCHGNDQTVSATMPRGPHGSNSKFMLTGNAKLWPMNAFGALWSLNDIKTDRNNWQNDLFCVNCHPMVSGGNFVNKVHDENVHQRANVTCITCHVVVPHGAKRSRLIGYATDVSPYNYLGTGRYDRLVISGFRKASGPNTYAKNNCTMNGVCHGTQSGVFEP